MFQVAIFIVCFDVLLDRANNQGCLVTTSRTIRCACTAQDERAHARMHRPVWTTLAALSRAARCRHAKRRLDAWHGPVGALAVAVAVAIASPAAHAQPKAPLPRIGVLMFTAAPTGANPPEENSFREGLHELGYEEGRNIRVERRYADGRPDRLR
jgi:hypothetical protein